VIQYYAPILITLYILYFITLRLLEKIQLPTLRERPVFITGCDSGFGRDLALKCVKEGMPVFAACFSEQGEKELAQEAAKFPGGEQLLNTLHLDVCSDDSVTKAREFVESKLVGYKGLWGIVNNAGMGDRRGIDDIEPVSEYDRMWKINCLGVVRVTHAFVDLVKKTRGRIVNVSSITGKFPMHSIGAYSVSKYAVAAYSDIIRMEYSVWGITVCVLEPGFFKTPQANPQVSKADAKRVWDAAPESKKEEYGEEYADWAQNLIADYLDYKCKPDTYKVVDAYFNALTSAYPRLRYQIGYDSTFQFTPLSYLPTRWQDWLVRGYLHYVAKQPRTKIVY